jgi:hypothetical protein
VLCAVARTWHRTVGGHSCYGCQCKTHVPNVFRSCNAGQHRFHNHNRSVSTTVGASRVRIGIVFGHDTVCNEAEPDQQSVLRNKKDFAFSHVLADTRVYELAHQRQVRWLLVCETGRYSCSLKPPPEMFIVSHLRTCFCSSTRRNTTLWCDARQTTVNATHSGRPACGQGHKGCKQHAAFIGRRWGICCCCCCCD